MNTLKKSLKGLSSAELKAKVEDFRRELFGLRLHAIKAPVKDVMQFKKLRKAIACGLTLLQASQK